MKTNKHTKVLYYHVVDTSCAGQCECSEGGLVGQCCADLHFMTGGTCGSECSEG